MAAGERGGAAAAAQLPPRWGSGCWYLRHPCHQGRPVPRLSTATRLGDSPTRAQSTRGAGRPEGSMGWEAAMGVCACPVV